MSEKWMTRALALAEKGRGRTSPNPMVGAVLVKNGQVIGEGYHPRAGEPHAEILALRQAGEKAQGATLYINLEPCCHHGRTGPCSQALIRSGVAKVYMAMADPNPIASGGRLDLERAGISTSTGMMETEAKKLNEIFLHWVAFHRPFVFAKFAMSLDGKIATRTGDARWISGQESRAYSHFLRDQLDAILIGANTAIADNPSLTARIPQKETKHPIRIVLDSSGRISPNANLVNGLLPGHSIVATTTAISAEKRNILEKKNVEVMIVRSQSGRVDIEDLLEKLGKREISSVLVEGGSTVLGSFFDKHLVDKVLAFIAPKIIGGRDAPAPVAGRGITRLADAFALKKLEIQYMGRDILISGYPDYGGKKNV